MIRLPAIVLPIVLCAFLAEAKRIDPRAGRERDIQAQSQALVDKGDVEGALEVLEKGIEELPEVIALRIRAAELWVARGRTDRAIAIYDALILATPNDPAAHSLRADLRMRCGEWRHAAKDYADAIRIMDVLDPASAEADVWRVRCWMARVREGEGKEATAELAARFKDAESGPVIASVGKYLAGLMTEAEFLLARRDGPAGTEDAVLPEFALAAKKLADGDQAGARAAFRVLIDAAADSRGLFVVQLAQRLFLDLQTD